MNRMNDAERAELDGLDPDIRRFVKALKEGYGSFANFDTLPMPERRRAAEQVRAPWRAGGPTMWRSIDTRVAGLRGRIHVPHEAKSTGAMLYLHGGGWTMFSIDTHDRLMREYASRAGVIVVGVDYSLSPEQKFPVAIHEAVRAVEWLRREGASHGIDGERLAIGGDSAGANLALAAALFMRERAAPPLRALLFNYGAFGPESSDSSVRYDGPRYSLTTEEMRWFWNNYIRQPSDLEDPLAAPSRADLHGLPPTLFTIAACDILADGNRTLAARMAAAQVPAEVHVYEGATHSFLEAVSISPLADRALDTAARWLRARLT
jgi:acetyl esterase